MALYHVVHTTPKTSPEKLTLTVVETQQTQDNEKADFKEEVSYLPIWNGKLKMVDENYV